MSQAKTIFTKAAVTGVTGLLMFYFFLLWAVTGDINHPIDQFLLFQPWMSLLIAGFGIQVGLFWLMKRGIHFSLDQKQGAIITSGTGTAVSGLAMVACCAHHLVDILPILGLSAAALFLASYQLPLLQLGILANALGIIYMGWLFLGKFNFHQLSSWVSAIYLRKNL